VHGICGAGAILFLDSSHQFALRYAAGEGYIIKLKFIHFGYYSKQLKINV